MGKGKRVTGTMGNKFAKHDLPLETDEQKQVILEKCLDSWYKRHTSSETMKQGSDNEVPISENIKLLDWVLDLYNIGVIECTDTPYIGVSCDGIDRMRVYQKVVLGCVEYKTRLSELSAIADAEKAVEDHGGEHVVCDYEDAGMFVHLIDDRHCLTFIFLFYSQQYSTAVFPVATEISWDSKPM